MEDESPEREDISHHEVEDHALLTRAVANDMVELLAVAGNVQQIKEGVYPEYPELPHQNCRVRSEILVGDSSNDINKEFPTGAVIKENL